MLLLSGMLACDFFAHHAHLKCNVPVIFFATLGRCSAGATGFLCEAREVTGPSDPAQVKSGSGRQKRNVLRKLEQ
jgi:hypothetical protein